MKLLSYLSRFEKGLLLFSLAAIVITFLLGGQGSLLVGVTCIIGATALIFLSSAHPIGQVLIIVFSLLYGYISFDCRYYGEMITYVGMTAPMAVFSLVSWVKNPYKKGEPQVKVATVSKRDVAIMLALAIAVTVAFYFILRFFNTSCLIVSTISVTTSFVAAALTFLRSPYYALGYAANDVVLIVLWSVQTYSGTGHLPMIVCFAVFLINDLYGFVNWRRIKNRQNP